MGKAVAGVFGIKGGDKEAALAAKRFSRAEALDDESIARTKAYLESWEASFGSLEKNISEYVNSLNPDVQASRQIADVESEYVESVNQINANFTKRFGEGVTGTGLKIAQQLDSKLSLAKIKAGLKSRSRDQVFQTKAGVYSGVVGQRDTQRGALAQAFQNASGTSTAIGDRYAQIGAQKDQNVADFGSKLFDVVASAATGMPVGSVSGGATASQFGANVGRSVEGLQRLSRRFFGTGTNTSAASPVGRTTYLTEGRRG